MEYYSRKTCDWNELGSTTTARCVASAGVAYDLRCCVRSTQQVVQNNQQLVDCFVADIERVFLDGSVASNCPSAVVVPVLSCCKIWFAAPCTVVTSSQATSLEDGELSWMLLRWIMRSTISCMQQASSTPIQDEPHHGTAVQAMPVVRELRWALILCYTADPSWDAVIYLVRVTFFPVQALHIYISMRSYIHQYEVSPSPWPLTGILATGCNHHPCYVTCVSCGALRMRV